MYYTFIGFLILSFIIAMLCLVCWLVNKITQDFELACLWVFVGLLVLAMVLMLSNVIGHLVLGEYTGNGILW